MTSSALASDVDFLLLGPRVLMGNVFGGLAANFWTRARADARATAAYMSASERYRGRFEMRHDVIIGLNVPDQH